MRKEAEDIKSLITLFLILPALLITGCSKTIHPAKAKEWIFYKQIKTGNAKPNGIVYLNGKLWISDPPNNRILEIDTTDKPIKEFDGFKRPMHISLYGDEIFVPEFLTDSIKSINVNTGKISTVSVKLKPDAPTGVSIDRNDTAVADFYNHRIIFKSNGKTIAVGKKGHGNGELFYPTDVSFHKGLLYVADAYNNRVQVFDRKGNFKEIIGSNESIKTAIGIFVNDTNIFVAGFDNNKIFQFDKEGHLIQSISTHLNHPSDIFDAGNKLFVSNYGSNSISVFVSK